MESFAQKLDMIQKDIERLKGEAAVISALPATLHCVVDYCAKHVDWDVYVFTNRAGAIKHAKLLRESFEVEGDRVTVHNSTGKLVYSITCLGPSEEHGETAVKVTSFAGRVAEYKGNYKSREWDTGKPTRKEVF